MIEFRTAPTGAPRPRNTFARIVIPKTTQGFRGFILSDRLTGTDTHWIDGRTRPCFGNTCLCKKERISARWKGWCGFLMLPSRERTVLEFTENAAHQLFMQVPPDRAYRGLAVSLRRRTNKDRSPVDVVVHSGETCPNLPSDIDVAEILMSAWGLRVRFDRAFPPEVINVEPERTGEEEPE